MGALRRRALAIAVGMALASLHSGVLANPSGATVVSGSASLAASGSTLTITNTPGAIINWQQFSIGQNEITRFIQQNAASAVLNRVTGGDPSAILGQLHSNGRVFLINPAGIAFGAGAQVNVGGLVASTLNISDADFLSGRMRFAGTGAEGGIANAGSIRAADGGQVWLVAPKVENQAGAVITSPKGEIVIAAGKTVELTTSATPDVLVEYAAPEGRAVNAGELVAASGRVGIYGTLVRNSGLVSASRAVVGDGGRIVFRAAGDTYLESGARVEAKGGEGGEIQVLGERVAVLDGATIDASGDTAGGTILVGGDFQGANPNVPNASRTYVGAEATLRADATASGDGGKVIVWADDVTRFYGTISARGGAQGGNGGFVEVSGKEFLSFDGSVNVGAASGASGTILLDPQDIVIQDTAGGNETEVSDSTVLFGDSPGATFAISDEALEALTGNVVLQASRDITVDQNLSGGGLLLTNQGDGERVVLQAGRDITIRSALTTSGADLWLEADSPHAAAPDGIGIVSIASGAPVSSSGGHITLIGGGAANPTGGFSLNADVNAGSGGINVSLTASGTLSFGIGAGGNTQLSSNQTGALKTTGALVLGKATTAGSDGLGTGSQELLVNSLTNTTASPIQLSAESGSSFELYAGDGGITLSRPLTTYQDTVISTTGTLTVNETLATSDNNLTITADTVVVGSSGSINIGSGSFTCTTGDASCTTLDVIGTQVFWDGDAGDYNWFNPLNWSTNQIPTLAQEVTIDILDIFGTINVSGGTAQAKSLIAGRPIMLSGGSLELANASNFSDLLTLSGGTLGGTGDVTISGPSGGLNWSAGTMSGGDFLLASGRSGTLSGNLTLDRLFRNEGFLTLSGATLNGSGALNNGGTVTVAAATTNTLAAAYANRAIDPVTGLVTFGTLQVNGALSASNFPTHLGTINVASGGSFSVTGGFSNSGSVTIDGSASFDTLAHAGGSLGGTGSVTVTTDFTQTGGTFGTSFTDIDLTHIGDFDVPGYTATNSVALHATGGRVTLNGTVGAGGSGDAIVITGTGFTNNAGSGALSAPSGRWLVWSGDPASDNRGGLVYDFKQYNASYGVTSVAGIGDGFLYTIAPTVTASLTGTTTKVYDGTVAASLAAANYAVSGAIDGDTVTLDNPGAGTYDNKNVGIGKTVSTTVALAGATDATGATVYGYSLSDTTASGTIGETTARPITVATLAGQGKTYGDDDPLSAASAYSLTGGSLAAGDTLGGSMGRVVGESVGNYDFTQGTVSVADGNGGNNYTITFDGATEKFAITPRALTATIADQTKTYGTSDPSLASISVNLGGVVNRTVSDINGNNTAIDDTTAVSAALASLARDSGENVGAYNVTGGTLDALSGASASNYSAVLDTTGNTLDITPAAALTATIADQTKVYGTSDPSLAGITVNLAGMVVNPSVTDWNGATTAIDDSAAVSASLTSLSRNSGENVGSYGITGGALNALTGASAANYSGATLDTTGTKLDITPAAALTATIADQTKVYGTDDPSPAGITVNLAGLVNASVTDWNGATTAIDDSAIVTASLANLTRASGENAGLYAITGGGLSALSGASASNYIGATVDTTGNTLDITPAAALTATIADQTKVYGTSDPSLAGISVNLAGMVNTSVTDWNGATTAIDDSVAVSASLASLTRTSGENIGSYAIGGGSLNALSGASAFNYSGATLNTAGNTLDITPAAALTATIADQTKVYGTSDPSPAGITVNLAGMVVNPSVTDWNGATTAIDDSAAVSASLTSLSRNSGENVGSYGITGGALNALSGASAANYSGATLDTTGNTLDITPAAALTATIADQSKVYGTDDPLLAGISVNLAGMVNTSVTDWNGATTAINDSAAVSASLASLTRNSGENVGSYAITTGTLSGLTGASASNYSGATLDTTGNTIDITPAAALNATIADQTKVYGTSDPSLAGITVNLAGMVVDPSVTDWNGATTAIDDTASVSTTLASLTRTSGENVGSYGITGGTVNALSGASASNYSGAALDTTANTLDITPAAALTATIVDQAKVYGTSDPSLAGISVNLAGMVVNPSVTDWNGTTTAIDDSAAVSAGLASLTRTSGETVGSYGITGGTLSVLSGASALNYSGAMLHTTGNTLAITPAAALTATVADQTKVYGTNDPSLAGIGVNLAGMVVNPSVIDWNGVTTAIDDSASVATSLASLTRTSGENVGSYAITGGTLNALTGSSAANYSGATLDTTGNTLDITPAAALTATISDQTKVYGTSDPSLAGIGVNLAGMVNTSVTDWNGATTAIDDSASVSASLASLTRTTGENVGSYAITGGTLNALSGASVSNYSGATLDTTGMTLAITPAATLTATIADQAKVYGTSDPSLSGISVILTGMANTSVTDWNGTTTAINDSAAVSASLASLTRTSGENVGSYAITGGALNELTGASASNYSGATLDTTGNTLAITQAASLTATIADQGKAYGTSDPALAGIGVNLAGLVNTSVADWNGATTAIDDSASVSTSLASLTRTTGENVGSYAISGGTLNALTGASASNYSGATLDTTGNTLDITPAAALTATITDQTKAYGTSDPSLAGISVNLAGMVNTTVTDWNGATTAIEDSAAVAASLASLTRTSGENVGTYVISGGGLNALSGASASNYIGATLDTTGNTLDITPAAALTATIADQTKVYGTNDPSLAGISVNLAGMANTSVTDWNGATTAIDDAASVSTSLASLTRTTGENVGSYAITGGTLNALSGASASNYSGATLDTTGNTLAITPAATLTATIANQAKVYGTSDASLSGISVNLAGLVNTSVTDWNGATTAIDDSAAVAASLASLTRTSGENVGSYAITGGALNALTGASASNYSGATLDTTGNTLDITPAAALTATIADQTKVYGTDDPSLAGINVNLSGMVSTSVTDWNGATTAIDDSAAVSASLASLARTSGENAGSYAITGGTLNALAGSAASNYSGAALNTTGNVLEITPATAYYTADPASRAAGESNPTFTGTLAGLVDGSVADWNGNITTIAAAGATTGTLQFTSTADASSPAGSYAIEGAGLTALGGNYVFAQAPENATALTVTPVLTGSVTDELNIIILSIEKSVIPQVVFVESQQVVQALEDPANPERAFAASTCR